MVIALVARCKGRGRFGNNAVCKLLSCPRGAPCRCWRQFSANFAIKQGSTGKRGGVLVACFLPLGGPREELWTSGPPTERLIFRVPRHLRSASNLKDIVSYSVR